MNIKHVKEVWTDKKELNVKHIMKIPIDQDGLKILMGQRWPKVR